MKAHAKSYYTLFVQSHKLLISPFRKIIYRWRLRRLSREIELALRQHSTISDHAQKPSNDLSKANFDALLEADTWKKDNDHRLWQNVDLWNRVERRKGGRGRIS